MLQGKSVVVYREFDQNAQWYTTQYSSIADLKQHYASAPLPKLTKDQNGTDVVKYENIVDVWNKSTLRKTYDQVIFKPEPGMVAGGLTLPDTENLNLYQGLGIEPIPGECGRICRHIWEIWCKEDQGLYDYVMNWLANMFQRPAQPGSTVLALKSGEGTGKNIIIDGLVEAFGKHATPVVRPDQLTGRFNDHLATSVLVFANEAVWGGDRSQEGALKSLITDRDLPVERKHQPTFRVRNCIHLIMATNNEWFAPVGLDDRRYVVMELDEKRKNDYEYFSALKQEMDNGGLEAFVHQLLNRDLSSFNVRQLPEQAHGASGKFNAKMKSADSVTRWWVHCLTHGAITRVGSIEGGDGLASRGQRDLANPKDGCSWESGPITVEKQELHEAYRQWARENGERVEQTTGFFTRLGSFCKYSERRPNMGGRRPRVLDLPSLAECGNQLDEALSGNTPFAPDVDGAEAEADSATEARGTPGKEKLQGIFGVA